MLINVGEELAARRAPRRCDPRPPRNEKRLARRNGAKEVDGAKEKSATARRRDGATDDGATACGMRAGTTAVSQQTYSNKRSSAMSTIV